MAASGDTLGLYVGEFLISPIPLEISFNYCSHKCAVCFANLNKPDRWFDANATTKTIQNAMSGGGRLVGQLLRDGYPVLASNRVDPFATSNYRQSVPVLQTLRDCGIPLCFQTRGGRGIEDILQGLPKSVWYISINQDDDELRKKVEPGAPSIESRFGLIERLASIGHSVVLGLNPLVPEWFDNDLDRIAGVATRAAKCGAKGMWCGWLHLNYKQVANMSERELAAVGEGMVKSAHSKNPSDATREAINFAIDVAASVGAKYYVSGGHPSYGGLWDVYRECYGKTFPCLADFIEQAKRLTPDQQRELPIDFEDFCDFALHRLPSGTFTECRDYVRTRQQVRNIGLGEARSFKDVLRVIWQRDEFKTTCPVNHPSMAWLGERIDGEVVGVHDSDGLPMLVCGKPECSESLVVEGY